MGIDRRRIGLHWEREAESFLHRRGLKTLQRNFNCRGGEIDLVMLDQASLVFVEVRFRSRSTHGTGAETIGRHKRQRLVRAARYYLGQHRRHSTRACRFDVISVSDQPDHSRFDWIRNAFDADEG